MLIEQLADEIRWRLSLHHCHHKACDCYKIRELLALLDALARLRYPWKTDLLFRTEPER